MPTARQTIGAKDFTTIVESCEPPCQGGTDSQKKSDYLNLMQNICEVAVDACIRRRNGSIDEWGFVETMQSCKVAISNLMRGVRG